MIDRVLLLLNVAVQALSIGVTWKQLLNFLKSKIKHFYSIVKNTNSVSYPVVKHACLY